MAGNGRRDREERVGKARQTAPIAVSPTFTLRRPRREEARACKGDLKMADSASLAEGESKDNE